MKPTRRPACPNFSSGPCAKRPGYSLAALEKALLGRSHRSKPGKARLKDAVDRSRTLLAIPKDYRLGIVPASDECPASSCNVLSTQISRYGISTPSRAIRAIPGSCELIGR